VRHHLHRHAHRSCALRQLQYDVQRHAVVHGRRVRDADNDVPDRSDAVRNALRGHGKRRDQLRLVRARVCHERSVCLGSLYDGNDVSAAHHELRRPMRRRHHRSCPLRVVHDDVHHRSSVHWQYVRHDDDVPGRHHAL
jgi:hypothetical protein